MICPCMVFADLHTRVKYNTTNRGPDECTLYEPPPHSYV